MAIIPKKKSVIPIPVKSTDMDTISMAISTKDKSSLCYFQTIDGKFYLISGNCIIKKVTKI
jgi:hypothetical protein